MMINYFTKTKAKKRLLVWRTVSLFVLFSFIGMQSARAQYTSIPDANFEQALYDKGIDTVNGDHQVLTSSISGVTSLDVSNKNIASLVGIEDFTSLQTLKCGNNQLSSLNVSNLTALIDFYCEINKLTSLNVSGLTNLQLLICYENQLPNLNVSSLTNLRLLNCDGNQLPILNLSGLTNLISLSCNANQLPSLTVSGLTNLESLQCINNQLPSLNVSGLTKLQYLSCGGNQLTSLNVNGLTALTNLDCSFNQLTSLNVSGLGSIIGLNCQNNQLQSLSLSLNLTNLNCNHNKLMNLNLNGLKLLGSLECGSNQLSSLNLSNLTNLVKLDCGDNQLTDLNLSSLTNLVILGCGGNQLSSLNLSGLSKLEELECISTSITSLNLSGLTALTTLSCYSNPNLTCILVSNVDTAGLYGTWQKDPTASYATTCGGVTTVTKIQASQCGASVTTLTTPIYANAFPGATAYKFEVTDGTNVRTYESTTRSFNFSQLTGTNTFGTTYSIGVAVKVNNVWGSNGSLCNVTLTMPTTSLVASRCGSTLTSLYAPLYANGVAIATGYRFQVSTGGTVIGTYESTTNLFNLVQVAELNYATTYNIKVAIQYNSTWQSYGTSCTVSTPVMGTTHLDSSLCGSTLTSLYAPLYANAVSLATGYSFEVSTGGSVVGTYAASSNVFNLMQLSGINYATTYDVKVAIQYNSAWQDYGTSCAVTTPAAITVTQLIASTCGKTLTSLYTPLYANPIVGAKGYSFQVSTGGSIVGTYAASSNAFNLMQLSGITYATVYSVKVAPVISGTTQAYGTACTVTTPALVTTQLVASRCGATVTSLYAPLYANGILGATGYRFEVSTGGSILGFYDAATNVFNLKQVAGTAKNTAYSIRVAVLFNGTYQSFGSPCTVTTALNANTRMSDGDLDATVFTVKAYPNPFATLFNLAIESSSDDQVEVKVYDMIGRELEARKATVSEWSTQELGNGYPQGVYNVIVTQGDQVKSLRMIKR